MINYLDRELKIRKQLAQADDTLPEILTALSRDSNAEVRLLVAGNPNTPTDVLQKLGEEFPDAITDNPVFNLLLLENIHTYFIKLSLARSSTTSAEILTKLSNARYYSEEKIVCAVANNPNAPIPVLEKLATWFPEIEENSDENDCILVRGGVASNLKTPVYILEELAKNYSGYVREHVAKNPNTPAVILEKLAKDINSDVLLAVANNPNTPLSIAPSLLEYLAGECDRKIRYAVLKHPHVTDTAIKIVEFVDKKPGITLELLEKLAVDKRRHIRYLVVEHPLVSTEILETLSHDEDANIRYEIIKHKNTSSETLQKLAAWLIEDVKKWCCKPYTYMGYQRQPFYDLIKHPNITSQAIEAIVTVKDINLKLAIAMSPVASTQVLEKIIEELIEDKLINSFNDLLYKNCFQEILISITENLNVSDNFLQKCVSSTNFAILKNIAQHPNVSQKTLVELVNSSPYNIVDIIINRKDLTESFINQLKSMQY